MNTPLARQFWRPDQKLPPPPVSKLKETQRLQLKPKPEQPKVHSEPQYIPPPGFISP